MGLDHHKGSASIRPIRTLTETSESQRSVNSSSRLTRKRLLPRPSAGGPMSKGYQVYVERRLKPASTKRRTAAVSLLES